MNLSPPRKTDKKKNNDPIRRYSRTSKTRFYSWKSTNTWGIWWLSLKKILDLLQKESKAYFRKLGISLIKRNCKRKRGRQIFSSRLSANRQVNESTQARFNPFLGCWTIWKSCRELAVLTKFWGRERNLPSWLEISSPPSSLSSANRIPGDIRRLLIWSKKPRSIPNWADRGCSCRQ